MLNSRLLRFRLKSVLYTEMINEFFIVTLLYNLLVFTDYTSDQRAKNYVGYSMMVVMVLNMVFNFTLILASNLGELYKVLRTKYYRWKRARMIKKLKDIIALAEIESNQMISDCA